MARRLTREEMIDIVGALQRGEGDDDQASDWTESLNLSVPHPSITDLIFFSERDMTAEEIVDEALAYRSIEL